MSLFAALLVAPRADATALAITSPAEGSSAPQPPSFAGSAEAGAPVILLIYSGDEASGLPVAESSVSVSSEGAWEAAAPLLGEGVYTALATQTPEGGEEQRSAPVTFTVEGTPQVVLQPIAQAVPAGTSASFTAAASGTPVPTVQWEVSRDFGAEWEADGEDEGAATGTLTVPHPHNGYEYRARFTNSVGSVVSEAAAVTVLTVPVVTQDPASTGVLVGEVAHFKAAASGRPTPSVQWEVSRDFGAEWEADGEDEGAATGTLTVPHPHNGYEYRAVFTNSVGSATSTAATLTVSEDRIAPVITSQPLDGTVTEGQDAVFTAAAEGVPTPSVHWQVSTDGGNSWSPDTSDPGHSSPTLVVEGAALAQSGNEYRAVFANVAGNATSEAATLTVLRKPVAPTVTTNPHAATVTAGHPVSFTAAASGYPTPSVQWQVSKDGGATWEEVGVASETLTLTTTNASENGYEYRAVFANNAGVARSAAATLTVDTVPAVTEQPQSTSVVAGGPAVFMAAATGSPAPSVHWQRSLDGGVTWAEDTVDAGAATDMLTVVAAKRSESGYEYRARFSNRAGATVSAAATLTVALRAVPPVVVTQPLDATVAAGQAAVFSAAGEGTPTPVVHWQRSLDGGVTWVEDTVDAGAATDKLTIAAASASASGDMYRAVFVNEAGEATSAAATLTVQTAPVVSIAPISVVIGEGETATFTAGAVGNPAPAVGWQRSTDGGATWAADGSDPGAGTDTLTVPAASSAESGNEYRAVFVNDVGQATSAAATLTVQAAPGPPSASFSWFPSTPKAGEAVSLVSTSSDPGGPIAGYRWDVAGALVPGGPVLTTSFATAGRHAVTLQVSDGRGRVSAVTETIPVAAVAPALMQPFPVVRIAGTDTAVGARLTLVTVLAPPGAKVLVTCSGHGCPSRPETRVVAHAAPLRFRRFERALRAGAVLQIRITSAGMIGKYTRFAIRRGRLPLRLDGCLEANTAKPIVCPS